MGNVSVAEAFSIGIGPSSSHTMGPMRAARRFLVQLKEREFLEDIDSIKVELFGSLAMTGKGHATDIAVLLGLEGETPEGVDPDSVSHRISRIQNTKELFLFGRYPISFDPDREILFLKRKRLPYHSNAMKFKAFDKAGRQIYQHIFYSVGGGFVVDHNETMQKPTQKIDRKVPYFFQTAEQLLEHCTRENKAIWEIVLSNEKARQTEAQVKQGMRRIWNAMCECVNRGIQTEGLLPGGLNLPRRAPGLYKVLKNSKVTFAEDPTLVMEWVSLYSMAVNEENAAGGRVVTAPTNGSAGVIPATLFYAQKFVPNFSNQSIYTFLLTATALLILYKENASISAAEMGCQGEIGVSSSMAAAGLTVILGGNNKQVCNAAEIAMEHHLGLTCDPVAGLVQIPCIERNSMGAIKAINAARLAMRGSGEHHVSLDAVIRTMKETGKNMKEMYKETSEGGLAVQIRAHETVC